MVQMWPGYYWLIRIVTQETQMQIASPAHPTSCLVLLGAVKGLWDPNMKQQRETIG